MKDDLNGLLKKARTAARSLAVKTTEEKNEALALMAAAILARSDEILAANAVDMENAAKKTSGVMLDRLKLTKERIASIADGILAVRDLPDPVGKILEENIRPNGLKIQKISVPLGVLAIVYESRPNVTADAAALAVKSGNACVLRGGSDAFQTSFKIVEITREAIKNAGLDENGVCMPLDTSRESVKELMTAVGKVDALIPRGGAGLIRSCVENAKVPCIQTGTGICHLYIDECADLERAISIVENAKTSRPSVCNALEVCLVHERVARDFLPMLQKRLVEARGQENKPPVEIRFCEKSLAYADGKLATEEDYDTEFLDYILAVKLVGSVEEAAAHIAEHSTGHSDGIITENEKNAEYFINAVDSAAVYVNASTRFTDGGEFGKGCEIGISTQKLHARGPMGLEELTSYKYVVRGNGQIR